MDQALRTDDSRGDAPEDIVSGVLDLRGVALDDVRKVPGAKEAIGRLLDKYAQERDEIQEHSDDIQDQRMPVTPGAQPVVDAALPWEEG